MENQIDINKSDKIIDGDFTVPHDDPIRSAIETLTTCANQLDPLTLEGQSRIWKLFEAKMHAKEEKIIQLFSTDTEGLIEEDDVQEF